MGLTVLSFLAVSLAVAAAWPDNGGRIMGGTTTTITTYPFSAALLHSRDFVNYHKLCGAVIVSSRSVMTAAHCVYGDAPNRWRIRVGSVTANSGGVVHRTTMIIAHANYNPHTLDSDIAVIRSATIFGLTTSVRVATIAGASFNLPDNAVLWAIGWGSLTYQGPHSETLRHVQIWHVNHAVCRIRYAGIEQNVTNNMMCAGWLDVGGRDQCTGDNGSPLLAVSGANLVVVGLRSWGLRCGLGRYPGVATRVSNFATWITANA